MHYSEIPSIFWQIGKYNCRFNSYMYKQIIKKPMVPSYYNCRKSILDNDLQRILTSMKVYITSMMNEIKL